MQNDLIIGLVSVSFCCCRLKRQPFNCLPHFVRYVAVLSIFERVQKEVIA
jgi:hypothetical protein